MRPLSPRASGLRDRMAIATASILDGMAEPDLSGIRAQVSALRDIVGGSGSSAGGAPDRIRAAVASFRDTGRLPDVRAARLVCWGTTIAPPSQPALIEDGERFAPLLDEVDVFRTAPRPYRRCWRGLLDGYLRYDPDGASAAGPGRRNWGLLREYLNDNLSGLERAGQPPDWLTVMDEHANILTEDPCGRYGATLVETSHDPLEPLRRELSAGDSSWFGRRIFEAQISAAVAFDDRRLRLALPRVLELIDAHPLLADAALARVLDRYAEVVPCEVEPELRDASVYRWGNPWLGWNDKKWTQVADGTRQMVSSWLKLRFIETFFGLLSEDKANDQRRIAFWKGQVENISDMYFALGEAAYSDPRPDFRALHRDMKGRLLKLENGGGARNNAFIMRVGRHVFVEFGEKGNAMFAFDGDALPFDLSWRSVSGNKTALKHPSHVARVIHMDSLGERWERKIEREMARLGAGGPASPAASGPQSRAPTNPVPTAGARATPGSRPVTIDAPPPWQAATAAPRPAARPSSDASPRITDGDSAAFLAERSIRSIDLRDRGGALWAYVPRHGPVAAELSRRGFAWAERKAAWWLKP